jgi:hypothetical protein
MGRRELRVEACNQHKDNAHKTQTYSGVSASCPAKPCDQSICLCAYATGVLNRESQSGEWAQRHA